MTDQCANLDAFFDGELSADEADAFTGHLATCERCQAMLSGRVQEEVIGSLGQTRAERLDAPGDMRPVAAAASGRPQRFSRWWPAAAAAAAGVVVTAGMANVICRPGADIVDVASVGSSASNALELALVVDTGKARMRGYRPHVGDRLSPSVRGDAYQTIWVFLDGRDLVTSCPRDPSCKKNDGGELSLELELKSPGKYTIVAVGSMSPIDVPPGNYDSMMAEVTKPTANKHVQVQHVDVD